MHPQIRPTLGDETIGVELLDYVAHDRDPLLCFGLFHKVGLLAVVVKFFMTRWAQPSHLQWLGIIVVMSMKSLAGVLAFFACLGFYDFTAPDSASYCILGSDLFLVSILPSLNSRAKRFWVSITVSLLSRAISFWI